MTRRTVVILAALTALAGAPGAFAHHGWSNYNSAETLNVSGKVQSVRYESPHVTIQLQTAEKVWLAVLAPPARMENRGLPKADLQPGMGVRVEGYAHRSEPDELRAERIVVGEKTIELR
ncbi:DUF6152 family protein [Gloeobacter morelensis]|uniref:DUF5666 domain-containing protein n=1 Tax=Gloeobacter morelensis MG652769 TaxID=2781736 RepID=A0ABY3PJQ9_9CYAN|nr:DUF6152 family protein [Gloeobacter morelensis]UFP93916.1 hypothetical protein ISF26_19410 [Gloeobacter morelensis MG652769]